MTRDYADDEDNAKTWFAKFGPWTGAAVALLFYIVTQVQTCAVTATRLNALESDVHDLQTVGGAVQTKVVTLDATSSEVNRRLARIEAILDGAPWVKKQ
jgi:hypothetical protein